MGIFRKGKERGAADGHEVDGAGQKTRGGIFRLYERRPWMVWGIGVSLISAFVFSCFYGVFRANAERHLESPIETSANISWLYQSCCLLYRDLENARHEEQLDYADVYLDVGEGYEWILDSGLLEEQLNYLEEHENQDGEDSLGAEGPHNYEGGEDVGEGAENADSGREGMPPDEGDGESKAVLPAGAIPLGLTECRKLRNELEGLESYFRTLDSSFQVLNSYYDYIIRDDISGKYVTNMSAEDMDRPLEDQYFQLSFRFDSVGNVTLGDVICGNNESQIRKFANWALREEGLQGRVAQDMDTYGRYGGLRLPADCTVTFGMSKEAWERIEKNGLLGNVSLYATGSGTRIHFYNHYYGGNTVSTLAYMDAGVGGILLLCAVGIALLGFFLPVRRCVGSWRNDRLCRCSLETLLLAGFAVFSCGGILVGMIAGVASGRAQKALMQYISVNQLEARFLVAVFNLLVLALFFFFWWYVGVCASAVRELGPRGYIRQRSLIYRLFPYIRGKLGRIYRGMTHVDLTGNAHAVIIRVLIVNAVILFMISLLWFGGIALTLAYSVVLYFILRKYISDLQKKYRILLDAVDEIAEGNLNVTINEDLGVFEPFREQLFKIQDGLKKAVDTEFRSQKMKVELITNMSHDLKTPLTAIITYVNLLKDGEITREQRDEYLSTLDRKSLRLKSLIEDLFEFSKANSDNVTLNIMDVDVMNLVKQVAFEMSDKLGESGLDVRMNLTEERVVLPLDSQKTYRVYENLFGNVAKYALEGTRVYVNGFRLDDTVVITIKNISAQEITVEAADLTERFVRGDSARNTEGSGLGLAIAKSFTELQGGKLEVEVDGDLFKVTTTWRTRGKAEPAELPQKVR